MLYQCFLKFFLQFKFSFSIMKVQVVTKFWVYVQALRALNFFERSMRCMGEKDIAEKILEDYPDVFADIVNGFLFDVDAFERDGAR